MANNHIEIKTKENSSGVFTEIYVDGCLLKNVAGYELKHTAGGVPMLTVDLLALNMTVDCPRAKIMNEHFGELEIKRKVD